MHQHRVPDTEALPFRPALARAAELAQGQIASSVAGLDSDVSQAMLYSVEGGKALRAFLVIEGARLHGLDRHGAAPAAAAIEEPADDPWPLAVAESLSTSSRRRRPSPWLQLSSGAAPPSTLLCR